MRHNRRRTALTMLGMAWGIATVVMLLAYGNGFGKACEAIFANFGTKLMIVVPGRSSMQAGGLVNDHLAACFARGIDIDSNQ